MRTFPAAKLPSIFDFLFPTERDGEILPAVLADLVGYLSVLVCMGFPISHIARSGAAFSPPFCF
jgi:hypothetical protein